VTQLILGIDPGTTESGICLIDGGKFDQPNIIRADKIDNDNLKSLISQEAASAGFLHIALEGMANQSRAFGQSSIETCYLIGRLLEYCDSYRVPVTLVKRHEYGRYFVTGGVLNDATLRAALETIWGPSAKKTDPLYALRGASDKRSAFALAKYWQATNGI
jgi:hypothetical protein